MKPHTSFLVLSAALAFTYSCGRSSDVDNGTVLTAADGSRTRIEVVTDDIVRVTQVPAGTEFSTKSSLAVIPQHSDTPFSIEQKDGCTIVSTSSLKVIVDDLAGGVLFQDNDGNILTREIERDFTPVEADGTEAFTVRAVFQSDSEEGFYGLGQHQADEWDYKGRNEELYQYNTKISIPFIVSSHKYGILWDSYSLCRWGDPREYSQLSDVFTLIDKSGKEGALTGVYYPVGGPVLVRRETDINQEYLRIPECDIVMNAPEGFKFGGSSVHFEGSIRPSESGIFRFYLYYAGYTKVFIDGKQVMPEIWRTAWNPNGRKFEVEMEADKAVPIRIEWRPDGDVSYCALKVLSPVDPMMQENMSWWGEMQDQIDYYFIRSESIDGVIGGYRTLTGKAQIMPEWALGYWQSRERPEFKHETQSVRRI